MDKEYLEEYEQKEKAEFDRFLEKVHEGTFSLENNKYPPDERFVKLQKPVAVALSMTEENFWVQVPFSGSLILLLEALPKSEFEEAYFPVSDIPDVIDFIKRTGRLQVGLSVYPHMYANLDYLDPFFTQLNPPCLYALPDEFYANEREIRHAEETFKALADVGYSDFLRRESDMIDSRIFEVVYEHNLRTYVALKLRHYKVIEDIEDSMIDNPFKAFYLLKASQNFITIPSDDLRFDLRNYSLRAIKEAQILPYVYQPQEVEFPHEIGRFLMTKFAYGPLDMRACYDIIDHYNRYDLQKVQKSLNEAIVSNSPNILNTNVQELSEILDNVWNDPTVPRRIKNIRRVPIAIAALGPAISAFSGGLEGFLAGLGFTVGAKFLDVEIKGLSEKIAKFFSRSYQANIYDFKKKYKGRIVDST